MSRRVKTLSFLFFIILIIAILGLFIHEMGHGLMAALLGGTITYFEVVPGLQLFPVVAWHFWDGSLGKIGYSLSETTRFQDGCITWMGSGSTAIIALLAFSLLVIAKPRGRIQTALLTMAALLPLDIVSYSMFPALGWRHWIIVGGTFAEPLEGAKAMGIPASSFYIGLGLYLLAVYGGLACYWRRVKANSCVIQRGSA